MSTRSDAGADFIQHLKIILKAFATTLKAGWKMEDWATLARSVKFARQFRLVLIGRAEVRELQFVIDFKQAPRPAGELVFCHKGGIVSSWRYDEREIGLYQSPPQRDGEGQKVKVKLLLEDRKVAHGAFGANLLDFYLDHPTFISESWKGKTVVFADTYKDPKGREVVRCLHWHKGEPREGAIGLDVSVGPEVFVAIQS